jgi:hypothetical protein
MPDKYGVLAPLPSALAELPVALLELGERVVNQNGIRPLDIETLTIDVVNASGPLAPSDTGLRLRLSISAPARETAPTAP